MFFYLLIAVIGLIGLVMTLIILLQSGKGGGLAGIAAGGATQQVLGARTAPDVLEKGTWVLGTAFIILCILTNFAISPEERANSVLQSGDVPTEQTLPPATAPAEAAPAEAAPPPSDGN